MTWGRLANGLAYAIMPNNFPEGHVSARLVLGSGSLAENGPLTFEDIKAVDSKKMDWPGDERGALHFLEHLSFKGGKYFREQDLIKTFQQEGVAFGPHLNATTSQCTVSYELDTPRSDAEHLEKLLKAMRDFAGGLHITPEMVEKERDIILSEKRDNNCLGYREQIEKDKFLFEGSSIASRFPMGSTRVINEITAEELRALYQRLYRPDNLALIVVGAVDAKAIEHQIQTLFGDLERPEQPLCKVDMGQIPYSQTSRIGFYRDADSTQLSVCVTRIAPQTPRMDTPYSLKNTHAGHWLIICSTNVFIKK